MTSSQVSTLPRSVKAVRAVLPLELAAYHAVHDYRDPMGRIGAPAIAAAFSWKATTLQNKLNPNEERNVLTARELECIAGLTQDTRLLDSICATLNAVWIRLPPPGDGITSSMMLKQIGEASAQLGQLALDVGEAVADNEISWDELAVMERTAMRITQAVQSLLGQARADIEARESGAK